MKTMNFHCFCFRLKYEQDLEVNLRHEKEKNETLCEQEAASITRLKEILDMIDQWVFLGPQFYTELVDILSDHIIYN